MFVPLLLDQVRVKDRPEVFLVFRLDRASQTANLLCLGPGIVERGVHWTMLEDAWDDHDIVARDSLKRPVTRWIADESSKPAEHRRALRRRPRPGDDRRPVQWSG